MSESDDMPDSKQIEIDVDDLTMAFQSQGMDAIWFLDLETGEVVMYCDGMLNGEDVDKDFDIDEYLDPDRHRVIREVPSSEGYEYMEEFINGLPPGRGKQALTDAISRNKPFRRFKDAIEGLGDIRDQWFRFEEKCLERKAQEWLDEEEIEAVLVKKVYGNS